MIHLGDITRIRGGKIAPVDVIIGGSPCQDLSVAGNRAGLAGERSGLFMEQIRIVKEMREHDRAAGRSDGLVRPRWMVWENVPGAFSSNKGRDFQAVLTEIIRIVEPEAPDVPAPEKGWATAGCLYDEMGRWSVAWRVHDAQFWGVPQRRRRIALVADFGGLAAPEVLFERKGLSWHTAESGAEGQRPPAGAESGADSAGTVAVRIRGGCDGGGKGTLIQTEKSGTLGCGNDQVLFTAPGAVYPDIARSLTARADSSPCVDRGMNIVVQSAICIQGNCIDRADTAGCNGKGWRDDDIAYTLNTIDRPAVLAVDCRSGTVGPNVNGTLQAKSSGGQSLNCNNVVYDARGSGTEYLTGWDNQEKRVFSANGVAPTLSGSDGGGGRTGCGYVYDARGNGDGATAPTMTGDHQNRITDYTAVVCSTIPLAVDGYNQTVSDTPGTLRAGRSSGDNVGMVLNKRTIRRLTPLECERLQGYPDGWTDIGAWTDSKGKVHKESSDSARYKALGNSIALPFWQWLLKRISAQYEKDATMGSLFDGIGGFPLIWEQINGAGSCLWASEIEEFCMAVTERRINGKDQRDNT